MTEETFQRAREIKDELAMYRYLLDKIKESSRVSLDVEAPGYSGTTSISPSLTIHIILAIEAYIAELRKEFENL